MKIVTVNNEYYKLSFFLNITQKGETIHMIEIPSHVHESSADQSIAHSTNDAMYDTIHRHTVV